MATSAPARPQDPTVPSESGLAYACVSQTEIAAILGVVARQVRNLEKAGLPREPDGYPVGRCVRWYVTFKAEEAVGRAQPKNAPPATRAIAEERKAIAEAGLMELRLERERGQLVEIAAYETEMQRILFGLRREINNLVGLLAPNVLHLSDLAEARRVVRRGRDELLKRLQSIASASSEGDEEELE